MTHIRMSPLRDGLIAAFLLHSTGKWRGTPPGAIRKTYPEWEEQNRFLPIAVAPRITTAFKDNFLAA